QSAEKVSHSQVQDFRHGTRRVPGTLNGELSPGTYLDLIAAILRKDFAAGVAPHASSAIDDVTAAAGPPGTFTRASGSFVTDGFKVGDVVRCTGWTTTGTANNDKNYRITALTATIMTVAEAVVAKTAGDNIKIAVVGGKSLIPLTSHTSDYFTFEKWFSDISQSERFIDVRPSSMTLNLPATGMATVSFGLVGIDMETGVSQYFTTPTAATSTGLTAAVNGYVRVGAS